MLPAEACLSRGYRAETRDTKLIGVKLLYA
jgi:hypothetical protein